jgi:hypothetical protein
MFFWLRSSAAGILVIGSKLEEGGGSVLKILYWRCRRRAQKTTV